MKRALLSLLGFDEAVRSREGEMAAALWVVVVGIVALCLGIVYAAFFRFRFDPVVFPPVAVVTSLMCGLAASPFVRLLNKGWFARYDEIRNSLSEGALRTYLAQFWEDRVRLYVSKHHLESEVVRNLESDAGQTVRRDIYDSLYHDHYGLKSLALAAGWLLIAIFFDTALATYLQYFPDTKIVGASAQVCVCAMAGAYIFAVGDSVLSMRQRKLNVSDVYWYALRLALALPIGVAAAGFPDTDKASVGLAFAIGLFPVDRFLKFFRRLSLTLVKERSEDKAARQLMRLEGVSAMTATLLEAEGVGSTDQLATMDPVLLAIRTGLLFRFILHLGSQAVAWRYLGDAASKLTDMALGRAESITSLLDLYAVQSATSRELWTRAQSAQRREASAEYHVSNSAAGLDCGGASAYARHTEPYFFDHPGATVHFDAEQVMLQVAERLTGHTVAESPSSLQATLFRFSEISADGYTRFLIKVIDEKDKALAGAGSAVSDSSTKEEWSESRSDLGEGATRSTARHSGVPR